MDYQILKLNIQNDIALVTISRPQAMNALNTKFFQEMDEMIKTISSDNTIKIMVLTGEGKAFVAGADIAEMVDMNSEQGSNFSRIGQNTFRNLEKLEINRAQFIEELKNLNVGVGVHFMPVHQHMYYKNEFNLLDKDYPVASAIFPRLVSLPIYPGMSKEHVNKVINIVSETLCKYKR